jgi:peptide/nickel transport system substrate-binding protein
MHVLSPVADKSRRSFFRVFAVACAAVAAALSVPGTALAGGGVLRVAMTAGDIPVTTGNPDQGFEGYRFVGYNIYDALLLWDLSKSDKPSDIKPGLATSYEIDPNNNKRWIVHLRKGVKFHDGCDFNADAVVWNFQVRSDQNMPGFSTQFPRLTTIRSVLRPISSSRFSRTRLATS